MTRPDSEIARESSRPSLKAGFNGFLRDLRRRKTGAIQRLVNRYESLALHTVRRHLGTRLRERVDSQDLRQDFWVSIIRRIDRLPSIADSQAFRGYLKRVAFRQITKQQRRHLVAERRRLTREVPLSAVGGDPPAGNKNQPGTSEDDIQLLDQLRPYLTDREATILTMKAEGLSNREIGRQVGIDEGSVRRSLRKIAKVVARSGPFGS